LAELRALDTQLLEAYVVIGEVTGLEDGGPIADICTDMDAQVHRRKFLSRPYMVIIHTHLVSAPPAQVHRRKFDEAEEEAEAERLEAERIKRQEAEDAALESMADAEEKIKKLQKLEKELNIETEEDLLEIMEKEQEKADRANAAVEAAQEKLKKAGEDGDEALAKEAAKELRRFITIASDAELAQAELSELKAMREKIEMEKSRTAWEQSEIKLQELKEQVANGADMSQELNILKEHTAVLKSEYERELSEYEVAQASADKEREEAEATKDAKEDAEMAASLALAEVSVAKERAEAAAAEAEFQREFEEAVEAEKVADEADLKALELAKRAAAGEIPKWEAEEAAQEAKKLRACAVKERQEAVEAKEKAIREKAEAAAAAEIAKFERTEAIEIKKKRVVKKDLENELKGRLRKKEDHIVLLFKLQETAANKMKTEQRGLDRHKAKMVEANALRDRANKEKAHLEEIKIQEAAVKEAAVERRAAEAQDRVCDDKRQFRDMKKTSYARRIEEEEISKTKASDAKDGAFTPMKRKVADEAQALHDAAVEMSLASLKELEDAEDDLKRNEGYAEKAWSLSDVAPSFRAAEAETALQLKKYNNADKVAKMEEEAARRIMGGDSR